MADRAPRGPANFRQRDLTAAIKAMEAAGKKLGRIEVGKDGGFIIIPSHESAEPVGADANEWDEDK